MSMTSQLGIRDILSQAQYAEVSYDNIVLKGANNTIMAYSSIHSFLTHAAMISKLLWSNHLKDNTSSKTLAEILEVSDTLKIKNRDFRNSLEHYDERLKKWIDEKGPNVNILDNNIGPRNGIEVPNAIYVRHYEPSTNIFTLIDEDLNLNDFYEEVVVIKVKAESWLGSH